MVAPRVPGVAVVLDQQESRNRVPVSVPALLLTLAGIVSGAIALATVVALLLGWFLMTAYVVILGATIDVELARRSHVRKGF